MRTGGVRGGACDGAGRTSKGREFVVPAGISTVGGT